MKITNIEFKEVKSLGNYESRALSIGAVLDEGESEADAINHLSAAVRWYVNKPEREIEYKKQSAILADKKSDEKALEHAKRYVARFDEAKAEIEG